MHLLIVQLIVNHVHGAMHGRHLWAPFNGMAEVNLSCFRLDVAVFARAGVGACTAPSSSLWLLETPSRLGVSAAVTTITTEATSTRARATERTLVTNSSLLIIIIVTIV